MEHIASVAHAFGLLGDSLNVVGAYLLAQDIFNRRHELEERDLLNTLAKYAEDNHLPLRINGFSMSEPSAPALILVHKQVKQAKYGFSFLVAGFLCLVVYRIAELLELWYPG